MNAIEAIYQMPDMLHDVYNYTHEYVNVLSKVNQWQIWKIGAGISTSQIFLVSISENFLIF